MPTPDFSALLRWPNVPACYGWLSLDRRGRWRLRGETVSHRGLNDLLNRQYAHDENGNYFVQNGPQRVFVELEYTPWVLHLTSAGNFETHVGEAVDEIRGGALDEEGNLLIEIPDGVALLCDHDLPALLGCLHLPNGEVADEASVLAVIEQAAPGDSTLTLDWQGRRLPLRSLRRSEVPGRYGFQSSPRAALGQGQPRTRANWRSTPCCSGAPRKNAPLSRLWHCPPERSSFLRPMPAGWRRKPSPVAPRDRCWCHPQRWRKDRSTRPPGALH